MKISIEYDSCWQNSILESNAVSEKPNKRKFKGNMKNGKKLTEDGRQVIGKSTILGVLYRLIGDQRTLRQIKDTDNHYFSDIEDTIDFKLKNSLNYEELAMIINKSNDRCGDGKYIGIPKDDSDLFFSKNAPKLWSVLYLSFDEMVDFIQNPKLIALNGSSMPRDILSRISDIQALESLETMERLIGKERFKQDKQKENLVKLLADEKTKQQVIDKKNEYIKKIDDKITAIEKDESVIKLTHLINNILASLKKHFPKTPQEDYIKKGGEIQLMRLYGAALYLQAELLEKSGENIDKFYVLQTRGPNKGQKTIQGFSRKGFNGIRDFLNPLSTGGNKKTVKTPFTATKSSGLLNITLAISKNRAEKIQTMINNAGVSSFYLGKKGLAFVEDINVMEDSL